MIFYKLSSSVYNMTINHYDLQKGKSLKVSNIVGKQTSRVTRFNEEADEFRITGHTPDTEHLTTDTSRISQSPLSTEDVLKINRYVSTIDY